MRAVVIAAMGLLLGCNSLLGIHELGGDDEPLEPDALGDPCVGTCECHVDSDCADPYSVCVDTSTSRTCECSAGYSNGGVNGGTNACAWTGVVAHPGFDGDGWTLGVPFILEPTYTATQLTDVGAATADIAAACQAQMPFGVSQQITMPRAERSEPLVTEVDVTSSQPLFYEPIDATVQMGRSYYDRAVELAFGPSQFRRCLGAGSYAPSTSTGPGAASQIGVTFEPQFCRPIGGSQAIVDHVGIQPAAPGECPHIGEVLNGDASGDGGWTFYTSSAEDTAAFAPSVGEQGSRAVELSIAKRCDNASASVPLSVPLVGAGGSYALSIYHAGTPGTHISVDGKPLPLSGGGQPAIDRYCLPAASHGLVVSLRASLSNSSGGACADSIYEHAVIDSVAIAAEPACGTDAAITDAGFESGLSLLGTYQAGAAKTSVTIDPAAHGGTHVLQISTDKVCDSGYFQTTVVAPAAVDGQGPAVKFWYRIGAGSARFNSSSSFTPVRDNQWHQGLACLDPARPERMQSIYWMLYQSAEGMQSCGVAVAHQTVAIDDIEVTSDPACAPMP